MSRHDSYRGLRGWEHSDSVTLMTGATMPGDGAGCRDRTRDPLITNQVLYQLS